MGQAVAEGGEVGYGDRYANKTRVGHSRVGVEAGGGRQ